MSDQNELTVFLPSLGDAVTAATITRWLVAPGDVVEEGTPLVEVATDKVDTEVPAPQAGSVLTVHAAEDDLVPVGEPLVTIALRVATDDPCADETPTHQRVDPPTSASTAASETPASTPPTAAADTPVPTPPVPAADDAAVDRTVEAMPRIRRTIARRMHESLQNTAQLTSVVEVDITEICALRNQHKSRFADATGTKLTFLPFFAKASLEALGMSHHKCISASVNDECTEITYHHGAHLGIAVDGPKGLMVPVIKDAQHLGIAALATRIAEAAEQVRAGTIRPDSLAGGTFTITNTGSRGALFDTPILNAPQSAILGTGAVVDRVIPGVGESGALLLQVRSMVYLSLTYDHRVIDGADAAHFLATVKQRLQAGFTETELFNQQG